MKRVMLLVLLLVFVWGCERAGPDAAWALQISPDTIEARRVVFPLHPGVLIEARPSADGTRLVGTDGETGDVVVGSAAGELRHVYPSMRASAFGPPGFANTPLFSPDGQRIAFAWYPMGPERGRYDLRVVDARGGEARVIYDAPATGFPLAKSWSPDGRQIAVAAQRDDNSVQILLVPVDGGEPQLLRSLDWRLPGTIAFSPDGEFLAYDLADDDQRHERDLFVYDLKNGRERRVLEHPADDRLLGWAPDGALLYASERTGAPTAWRVEMREGRPAGEPRVVKQDFWRAHPVGFTSTGDYFYAVRAGGVAVHASTIDLTTGRPSSGQRTLAGIQATFSQRISVSPDGRMIAYKAVPRLGPASGDVLTIRPVEGGEPREIHLPPRINNSLAAEWTADGTGIVFVGAEKGRYGLFRLDTRSSGVEHLFDVPEAGSFSFDLTPDGRSIVYRTDVARADGSVEQHIVLHDISTGAERVLAQLPGESTRLSGRVSIAPDGQSVAFHRNRTGPAVTGTPDLATALELAVMPIAGGPARVVGYTSGGFITWTGDSKALIVSWFGERDAVRIPVGGGQPLALSVRGRVLHADATGQRLLWAEDDSEVRYELWMLNLGRGR
jgi:Tol biopolymer transport system component